METIWTRVRFPPPPPKGDYILKYVIALFWVLWNRPLRYWIKGDLSYIIAQVSLRANYWSLSNPPKGKLRGDKTFLGRRYYYISK